MATYFFPKISASNYAAFVGLINGDMPKTFEEWERRQANKRNKNELESLPHGSGKCIEIEIDVAEFVEFCRCTDSRHTIEALERLASTKGMANKK